MDLTTVIMTSELSKLIDAATPEARYVGESISGIPTINSDSEHIWVAMESEHSDRNQLMQEAKLICYFKNNAKAIDQLIEAVKRWKQEGYRGLCADNLVEALADIKGVDDGS